jgi:hypothetical protein
MNPTGGNGHSAGSTAPAKEITNTLILPSAEKMGKSSVVQTGEQHG